MLTKENIQSLHYWAKTQGVKFYDVQIEIVDHIATSIESKTRTHPDISIQRAFEEEIENWPKKKIDQLIKSKKHHLYWSWYRNLGRYILEFFQFPKIMVLVALTASISAIALFQSSPLEAINTINYHITNTLFIVLIFVFYQIIRIRGNKENPLLVSHAYIAVMGALPLISFTALGWSQRIDFDLTLTHQVIYSSFCLSFYILLMYALVCSFPKKLKKETLSFYEHLRHTTK